MDLLSGVTTHRNCNYHRRNPCEVTFRTSCENMVVQVDIRMRIRRQHDDYRLREFVHRRLTVFDSRPVTCNQRKAALRLHKTQ